MKFCSIVITYFASDASRSKMMRGSLGSLINNTKYPMEIIVIDNGGNKEDSDFLNDLLEQKKINVLVRNAENMHFGFARNQGIQLANGEYICIADSDIGYEEGWLQKCIDVLEAHPKEKIYATPVYNVAHWTKKYWVGELKVGKETYRLNRRAGSNCFVIRRRDLKVIGTFMCHRVAGTKWTDKAWNVLHYAAAVTPDLMVRDLGFRRGYNTNEIIEVKMVLSDGTEVYFSEDEFKTQNVRSKPFVRQKARSL